jgi:hypothetical protein
MSNGPVRKRNRKPRNHLKLGRRPNRSWPPPLVAGWTPQPSIWPAAAAPARHRPTRHRYRPYSPAPLAVPELEEEMETPAPLSNGLLPSGTAWPPSGAASPPPSQANRSPSPPPISSQSPPRSRPPLTW